MNGQLGIVGASGFIGRELARQAAEAGWVVHGFSRTERAASGPIAHWREWTEAPDFAGLDAIVNLAGEPVNQRWTKARQRLFRESRIGVTERIAAGIGRLSGSGRPSVLVNASAVGIYGNRGDELLDESSAPGGGYLADLCRDWEDAAERVAELGPRVLKWRIGIVLGRDGDAFRQMLIPFRLGLGGRLGSGQQWMPWIHVEDLASSILHGIGRSGLHGAVNGSSPQPERNIDFTRKLGAALRRPALLPVPAIGLRALLGDFAGVILASQRVIPRVLLENEFHFRYPTLELALSDLLTSSSSS